MKAPLTLPSTIIICVLGSASVLHAGTVTTPVDDLTPGSGSLRAVLAAATNGETIDFAPSLDGALITLVHGELAISGLKVTIDANSLPSGISISGDNTTRILNISSESNVTLSHLTLLDGKENIDSSGALQASGGQLNMTQCVIKDSYARRNGGGIFLLSGIVAKLDRCTISGNRSDDFGGGICLLGTAAVTITNTEITGNSSSNGGGIFVLSASPTLINTTIQGNFGEGIRAELSSTVTIRNSIVWGNRIDSQTLELQQLRPGAAATFDVDYTLVEGSAATRNNLNGTLAANIPKFVTPAIPNLLPTSAADVRLLNGSTSINIGDNSVVSQALDLAGLPRIQGFVDFGAFEGGYVTFSALHPALLPAGDENQNGISNYVEYALGVNPSGDSAFSAMPIISSGGGFEQLTTQQRINGLDVKTSWITSTTLNTLSWQPMKQDVNYSLESNIVSAPGIQQFIFKLLDTDPARFYRQGFSTGN